MPLGLVSIALLALCGCISVGGAKNEPPPSLYTLHPAAGAATRSPQGSATIAVPKPELPTGFDSDRITLYLEKGRRLDVYAGAKWSVGLDELLQDFVIRTARQSLRAKMIGTPELAPTARYRLVVKITDFQPVYADTADGPPRLDVGITVTLLTIPGNAVKTEFSIKKSADAPNTLSAVVSGLESLLQSVTVEALRRISPYVEVR